MRGDSIDLTPTEYDLLLMLAEHAGTVMGHEQLLQGVWGQEYTRDNDYLKVYIWHLRRKLERDPREPKLLLTEWAWAIGWCRNRGAGSQERGVRKRKD